MNEKTKTDILNEAVADAEAIKEKAIDQAKEFLAERFAPQIKEGLEKKLKEEDEKIHKSLMEKENKEPEKITESDEDDFDIDTLLEEIKSEILKESEDEEDEDLQIEIDLDDDESDEINESKNKKVKKESDDEDEDDEMEFDEEEDEDDKVEESKNKKVKKESDDEDDEDDDEDDEMDESLEYEIDVDELTETLGIILSEEKDKMKEEDDDEDDDEEMEDDDEDITTEKTKCLKKENDKLKEKLKEYEEKVDAITESLQTTKFLNQKLKYANMLTSAGNLTETQKQKIITAFDKTSTNNELKLTYETLIDAFNLENILKEEKEVKKTEKVRALEEGSSRPEKNTLVENGEIINENKFLDGYERIQKLAGIKTR